MRSIDADPRGVEPTPVAVRTDRPVRPGRRRAGRRTLHEKTGSPTLPNLRRLSGVEPTPPFRSRTSVSFPESNLRRVAPHVLEVDRPALDALLRRAHPARHLLRIDDGTLLQSLHEVAVRGAGEPLALSRLPVRLGDEVPGRVRPRAGVDADVPVETPAGQLQL